MQHSLIFTFLLIPFLISCSTSTFKPSKAKQIDTSLRLHDIWALERVAGKQIDLQDFEKHPYIEINLTTMFIIGHDGCNDFSGPISSVETGKIAFGTLKSSEKICHGMKIADTIKHYLPFVRSYKMEDLQLFLYNQTEKELLTYRKVD